ncbi:MAG: MobF family relaxase, partial [Jatrophihabitantaceae bacterium]
MHKITAGDGYTYLTRQVAAMDSTERGYDSLNDYYSAKGETPGRWWGKGLQALDVAAGSAVTEAQMKALFGEGRHPNADAIEATLISEGMSERAALSMTRLGSPYRIFEGTSEWRRRLAIGYADYNAEHQAAKDAPIPAQDRARIRTEIAAWYFGDTYGRDPIDERELNGFIAQQSRPSTTAVAGFDLTFSPVKSVSTLWATAPAPIREELAAAHAAAVDHALTWVQNNIAYTRLGDGGPAQVDTTGLMVARFDHRDSRNGDPQLHTHCAVSSKVQLRNASDPIDGWRALDGRLVYELKVSAGEEYNTALEQQIVDRLGGEFVEHASHSGRRGIRDLAGVDHQLNTEFSSRRAEIVAATALLAEKFVAEHHRQPTPLELIDLAQQANLETRQAKHDPQSAADQHALWAWRAGQVLNLPAEQVGEH